MVGASDLKLIMLYFFCWFITEALAAGYSGHLTKDFQTNTSEGKSLITNWIVESPYGFYENLMYENGHFSFPKEGIYLLSANIILESKPKNLAEVFFEEKDSRGVPICRSFDQIATKSTITLACFARLKKLTRLGLSVSYENPLIVYRGSSLSIQYIGNTGDTLSFIQPLRDFTGSNRAVQSTDRDDYSYFNSFTVADDISTLTVHCTGIYVISISANVIVNDKSKLQLLINTGVVLNGNSFVTKGMKSITFLSSFFLNKGDLIKINIDGVSILEPSIYSIVLMSEDFPPGFSLPVAVSDVNDDVCKLTIHKSNITTMPPFYFNHNKDANADVGMEILMDNLYMISLQVEYSSQDDPTRFVISNDENSASDDLHSSSGLASIDVSSTKNKFRSINIVGVLRIRRNVRLNIEIKSCKRFKLREGFLSLVPIIQNTYATSATVNDLDGKVKYCKDSWIVLENFFIDKEFLLSKYMTKNGFVVPNDGLYFIYAEINLKSSIRKYQTVTFALRKTTANQNKVILKNIKLISNKQDKMYLTSHLELRRGCQLQLLITCGGAVRIVGQVQLKIIYNSVLFSPLYLISTLKENDTVTEKAWTRNLSPIIQEAGVYFLAYIVTLKIRQPTTVTLYVHTDQKSEELGLSEQLTFHRNGLTSDGTVTLETMGHLKLRRKEEIIVKISFASQEAFDITEDRLTLSSGTHAAGDVYGFKTRQRAQKLFNFNNKLTRLDNFAFGESTGGFLLPGTKFFGPYFVTFKPMTIFYHVIVNLKNVQGLFKLSVRIRPRNTLIDISTAHEVKEKSSITLSAVGMLTLASEESLQLLVYGSRIQTSLVLCTGSLWSVVEISTPITELYRHYPQVGWSKDLLEKYGTYAIITSKKDQIHKQKNFQLVSYINKENDLTNLIGQKSDILLISNYIKTNFNQSQLSNFSSLVPISDKCFVYLLMSPFPAVIEQRNAKREIYLRYDKMHRMQTYQLLCLNSTDQISVKWNQKNVNTSEWNEISSNTIKAKDTNANETLSFVRLQRLDQTEGFASTLSKKVNVVNGEKRLDRWNAQNSPFFDQTYGIADGKGIFISQKNGNYLISLSLVIGNLKDSQNRCHIHLRKNDINIQSILINQSSVSLKYIVWFQRNDALQIFVQCGQSKISIRKNSTWAVIMLDTSPSFERTCEDQLDQIYVTPYRSKILLPARSNFTISCSLKSKQNADYLWLKNDMVLVNDLGQRTSVIHMHSVEFNDTGLYECVMTRGKFKQTSNVVAIVVFEPRPTLLLSNDTVFIQENYEASKLLAWVHVSAIDLQGINGAAVKLSIAEGNDDGNFYFEPEVTNAIASLYFRKPFNYENQNTYKLLLQAQNIADTLTVSLTTKYLVVNVINENEYKPRFVADTQTFYLTENTPVNTKIDEVNAVDPDDEATLTYTIFYTSFNNAVLIQSDTGELLINALIDREVVDVINILVKATDGIYSAFQQVKVIITDVNDNRPQFEQTFFEKALLLNDIESDAILKVTATDPDYGDNGKITYKLINASDHFFLNRNTGEVFVNSHPAQLLYGRYRFQIEARDSGLPSLSQTCSVVLNFLIGNETVAEKTIVKSLHHQIFDALQEWRYWIITSVGLLLLFLLVLLLVCYCRYKRSRKEVKELLTRTSNEEETLKSLLKCSLKETESAEMTMYISSETLPSAYQSRKDLSKENLPLKIYESQLCINGDVNSSHL